MKVAFYLLVVFALVQTAHARGVKYLPVPLLFELAPLVITAEVTSIESLGVETTLSYPTVQGVDFEWLRVTCKVSAVLKGQFAQDSIDVAMLAVKKSTSKRMGMFMNGPLMLSPSKGKKYVMFLAPSSRKGVYASIFAPYDERNAIFILDRKVKRYEQEAFGPPNDYTKELIEKKDLVWSLVTEDGQFSKTGANEVAKRYKSHIDIKHPDFTISLEWKKYTAADGWIWDVPKNAKEVKHK